MPDVMFLIKCLHGNEFRNKEFWTLHDDLIRKPREHDKKQITFEYLPFYECVKVNHSSCKTSDNE